MSSEHDCIFCKIAAGDIPAKIVSETDEFVSFHDIAPQAPVHVLTIPRRHVESLAHISDDDSDWVGRMFTHVSRLARELELDDGYRVVVNIGGQGGQTVHHLHVHLLGGRSMQWPPG